MPPTRTYDDRAFAIDTAPLLDLLLLEFSREPGEQLVLPRVNKKIRILKNPFLAKAFEQFVRTRGPLFSTPGVVVEIDRHVRDCSLGDERQGRFRRFMIRWLNERIEEKPVRLCEMDPALVAEFGPVDASLLRVAQTSNRPVTLVASDGSFAQKARELRVACMTVYEVLALPDDSRS